MSRLHTILLAVLGAELGIGAALAYRQWDHPAPPLAELSYVDPLTARQLRGLARNCRSADDWSKLGLAYMAYGYFSEAEACCRQAAALAPERADLAYDWGFALERLGRYPEANHEYERAIQRGHGKPGDCWYYVGRNWLRLENADEARAAFLKAGQQPSARYEVARLLVRAGKAGEAVPLLDKLSAEHPKAVQPYLLRYRIEALEDSPLTTVYADRAALAKDVLPSPWNDDYARIEDLHNRLGAAGEWAACLELVNQRKFAEAEPRLRTALAQAWDPAGIDLLAKVEAARGKPDDALILLQGVNVQIGPTLHFLTRVGDLYEQTGDGERAAQAYSRAVLMAFQSGAKHRDYQHKKLASYYERLGDKAAARRHTALAYFLAGQEDFWDEKLQDAQIALVKAVELEPELDHAWFYLGETRRLLGRPVPAREAYERCLKVNPDHGRAATGLALLKG